MISVRENQAGNSVQNFFEGFITINFEQLLKLEYPECKVYFASVYPASGVQSLLCKYLSRIRLTGKEIFALRMDSRITDGQRNLCTPDG